MWHLEVEGCFPAGSPATQGWRCSPAQGHTPGCSHPPCDLYWPFPVIPLHVRARHMHTCCRAVATCELSLHLPPLLSSVLQSPELSARLGQPFHSPSHQPPGNAQTVVLPAWNACGLCLEWYKLFCIFDSQILCVATCSPPAGHWGCSHEHSPCCQVSEVPRTKGITKVPSVPQD